jgi:hypothetical protein
MARADLSLPDGRIPIENVSFDFRDDLSWICPDDRVGSLLLSSVREDCKLYQWALNRLDVFDRLSQSPQ